MRSNHNPADGKPSDADLWHTWSGVPDPQGLREVDELRRAQDVGRDGVTSETALLVEFHPRHDDVRIVLGCDGQAAYLRSVAADLGRLIAEDDCRLVGAARDLEEAFSDLPDLAVGP